VENFEDAEALIGCSPGTIPHIHSSPTEVVGDTVDNTSSMVCKGTRAKPDGGPSSPMNARVSTQWLKEEHRRSIETRSSVPKAPTPLREICRNVLHSSGHPLRSKAGEEGERDQSGST
jgi:hypothetical protein